MKMRKKYYPLIEAALIAFVLATILSFLNFLEEMFKVVDYNLYVIYKICFVFILMSISLMLGGVVVGYLHKDKVAKAEFIKFGLVILSIALIIIVIVIPLVSLFKK